MKGNRKSFKRVMCLMVCIIALIANVSGVKAAEVKLNQLNDMQSGMVLATICIPEEMLLTDSPNGDIVDNGVRLRKAPNTSSTVLELMYEGEYVYIDYKTSFSGSNGTWFYVTRIKTGTKGWVNRDYVRAWD